MVAKKTRDGWVPLNNIQHTNGRAFGIADAMARPATSFVPSPPESAAASTAASSPTSPSKRTFQSTLFNVKFGAQRNRLPPTKADGSVAKRTRSQAAITDAKDGLASDTTDDSSKRAKIESTPSISNLSAAPKYHHRGPFSPSDAPRLLLHLQGHRSTRRRDILQAHFIDRTLAEEWRSQLDRLPEWYRPKLKVYGREITQSREIAAYATAPGLHLKYSGHLSNCNAPFPPLLNHIASLLSSADCLGEESASTTACSTATTTEAFTSADTRTISKNKVFVTVSLGRIGAGYGTQVTPGEKPARKRS